MRRKLLIASLVGAILLMLGLPTVAGAQNWPNYDRNPSRNNERYDDRYDQRDVRDVINRLENDSAQLQSDMNNRFNRRVFGFVVLRDDNAIAAMRDFRQAVRALRRSSNDGRDLYRSRDEAQLVLDRGASLERIVRRANDNRLDSDMFQVRRDLQRIADTYNLNVPY